MRLVVDTNILISALLIETSLPARLILLWRQGQFDLVSSAERLDELMRVTRYPKVRERLNPALAGRLVNQLRELTIMTGRLPVVTACADPYDSYLLAMAEAVSADFLLTGDKRDLLSMQRRIITVRNFLEQQGHLPHG
ncbi:putative toxin-antitoxin system toxin component, PIN family [Thauera butanivorans]|uniref:putative toxin-antitoxin system toxin component, PIN family n=1 Tax=Thauera butanivorans TaxID=86174 RepID=UPI003AB6386F